jgi:hypothetical protein
MELDREIIDNITTGNYAKATFEFQKILADSYENIKQEVKKEFKYE